MHSEEIAHSTVRRNPIYIVTAGLVLSKQLKGRPKYELLCMHKSVFFAKYKPLPTRLSKIENEMWLRF